MGSDFIPDMLFRRTLISILVKGHYRGAVRHERPYLQAVHRNK